MAVSRAAASLSLTIGVAVATFLVAGGILVGPSIVQCSKDSAGLGACLRAKAQAAGLLHSQDDPPTSASRPGGWIAADATEYEPSEPATANLTGVTTTIAASGSAPSVVPSLGDVQIAPATGALTATVSPLPQSLPTAVALAQPPSPTGQGVAATAEPAQGSVDLLASNGTLAATAHPSMASPPTEVALAQPPSPTGQGVAITAAPANGSASLLGSSGALTATANVAATPADPAQSVITAASGTLEATAPAATGAPPTVAELSPDLGQISAGADLPTAPRPAQSDLQAPVPLPTPAPTLRAELPAISSIEQVAPHPVQIVPPVVAPRPTTAPRRAASIVDKPKPVPRVIQKYDPRYPNVLVLPPPNTGANSSFATLELR